MEIQILERAETSWALSKGPKTIPYQQAKVFNLCKTTILIMGLGGICYLWRETRHGFQLIQIISRLFESVLAGCLLFGY